MLPWGPGRRWRILMLDAYRAHLVEAVKRLAWSRGYVVVYQGGGCTGISQVNDTDQNETVDETVLCKVSKSWCETLSEVKIAAGTSGRSEVENYLAFKMRLFVMSLY